MWLEKYSILAKIAARRYSDRSLAESSFPLPYKVFRDVRALRPRPGRRKLFVTTALPYANGPFHIGHVMEYIQADIWVRFQRMQGHDVHFVGAEDAHGAPIMLKAEAEGVTPEALVTRIAATRPKVLDGFHLSFDHWHSTDSPENVELSQDIYRRLKANSFIYTKPVEQFYDPVKAMFRRIATSGLARSAAPRTSTPTPARSAAPSTRRRT